jgi:hypothetical protein
VKRFDAKVTWLSPEQGGLEALPSATRYMDIARFKEDGPQWPAGLWTVILHFTVPPSEQGNPSFGTAGFLTNEAPQDRLRPGMAFDVGRGARHGAIVELSGEK